MGATKVRDRRHLITAFHERIVNNHRFGKGEVVSRAMVASHPKTEDF
jgi:hypothetical protein